MDTGGLAGGIAVVLIGALVAGGGWYLYQTEQADIENAVEVEGVIEGTSIDRDVDRRDRDDDGVRERQTSFRPVVNYTYSYDGEGCVSDSVYPGPEKRFDRRSAAADVTDQYAAGDTVPVYVNRVDPGRAFLIERSDSIAYFAVMGFGGLVGILGVKRLFDGITGN